MFLGSGLRIAGFQSLGGLCGGVGLLGLPDLDELDTVDSEGVAVVRDEPVLGDGPALVELADLGLGDDDLVLHDAESESLGGAEVHLHDALGLLDGVGDLLDDGQLVHEVVAGQGAVEVDLDASSSDGEDDTVLVAEADGHAGVGVDLVLVELLDGVQLDELGVPGSGGFLAGDGDLDLLSDLGAGDGGVQVGVEGTGSDDVGHGGVGDLLVEDAGLLGCIGVRRVVEPVCVCEVGFVVDADNPFSVCHLKSPFECQCMMGLAIALYNITMSVKGHNAVGPRETDINELLIRLLGAALA